MEEQTFFDYYYGGESEQFAFYRIPRQLVTGSYFKNLSTDAKLQQNHLFQNVNPFLIATAFPSIRAILAHSRILFSTSRYRVSYSTRCWEQCCFS